MLPLIVLQAVVAYTLYSLWRHFNSPLRKFPGPFVAKFTNLWRVVKVAKGQSLDAQKVLHQQHGTAVQLGPNMISLDDPSLIKTVYSVKGTFVKSDRYSIVDQKVGNQMVASIFSTRNNEFHASQVKPIQKHYALKTIMDMEPLIDRATETLVRALDTKFVDNKLPCELNKWLLYYAWDVVGLVTFGEPIGFLERGADIQDIQKTTDLSVDYFGAIGQEPKIDWLIMKNPIRPLIQANFGPIVGLTMSHIKQRQEAVDKEKTGPKDQLDLFLKETVGDSKANDFQILNWLMGNIQAGSDTTAATLRAILYYVLKNPQVDRKLYGELEAAKLETPVQYRETRSLPYLGAVVQEACRMCPGVGLPLERVVPPEGLQLPDGRLIPGGTVVGMNPWIIHGNKEVYGQDADIFRPERWLRNEDEAETEGEFDARRLKMKEADLTFGAGNRVCLGKNISLVEIFKIVPTLLLRYKFRFVDPNKEWQVHNTWFVRQSGMEVLIEKRL